MTMRSLLPAGLLALTCLLAACGGDGRDEGTDAANKPVNAGQTDGGKEAAGQVTPAALACSAGDARACLIEGDIVGQQSCEAGGDKAVWGACEALPCEVGERSECRAADGSVGVRQCQGDWSECGRLTGACQPGESSPCGGFAGEMGMSMTCSLEGGEWTFSVQACNTPLVVSFDGSAVQFTQAAGDFDVQGAGVCAATDWVTAATPWLAFDRDGNGRIDDGAELFGSMTRLPDGRRASQGFEALAPLDSDGDGRLTPADEAWSRLVLWRDTNQDRVSQPGELRGLDAEGVVGLDLSFRVAPHCAPGGSCEVERATVRWRDASGVERRGAMIDVRLADR